MSPDTKRERILIWGKTYPELSSKYIETVCTAGVTESGAPLRLYPIPYRYLSEQFDKYQWITANISKNPADPRPESYRVDCQSIECGQKIPPTSDEWGKRASYIFKDPSWHFQSVEDLQESQRCVYTSIGVVEPREIRKIEVLEREGAEVQSFDEKFNELARRRDAERAQLTLFEEAIPPEMKKLDFLQARIQIAWHCRNEKCNGHKMQILDWEVCELQRKNGNEKAIEKLREITDLSRYDLRFFLGNLFLYPQSFVIVGLWYPKKRDLLFR